jgi:hypothetical protein
MITYFGVVLSASAFSSSSVSQLRRKFSLSYGPLDDISGPSRSPSSAVKVELSSGSLCNFRYERQNSHPPLDGLWTQQIMHSVFVSMFFVLGLHMVVLPAWADEYGVEKEAPTIFTGETVEVCLLKSFSLPCWFPYLTLFHPFIFIRFVQNADH